jgi:hypothetical protein
VVFVNGVLKPSTELPVKTKRWPDTRGIQTASALYINQSSSSPETPVAEQLDEQGDFQSKEDKEYRAAAERDKHRVSWNVERRCFLSQTSSNS